MTHKEERRSQCAANMGDILTTYRFNKKEKIISELQDKLKKYESLIKTHNAQCIEMCGDKTRCGFKNYNRDCGDCYKDYVIEIPDAELETMIGKENVLL